jgi:hypothetical protein
MKQATKMVLGAAAIVAVSAGVAGVTAYSMLKPEPNKSVAFNDVFQQSQNHLLINFALVRQILCYFIFRSCNCIMGIYAIPMVHHDTRNSINQNHSRKEER